MKEEEEEQRLLLPPAAAGLPLPYLSVDQRHAATSPTQPTHTHHAAQWPSQPTGHAAHAPSLTPFIHPPCVVCGWGQDYKEFLEGLIKPEEKESSPLVADYKEHHTDATVHFSLDLVPGRVADVEAQGLHAALKLTTKVSTGNMMLFDASELPAGGVPAAAAAAD